MISATASLLQAEEVEGVFRMVATEQKSVNILVESADTVAKAVYSSDKGEDYKLLINYLRRTNLNSHFPIIIDVLFSLNEMNKYTNYELKIKFQESNTESLPFFFHKIISDPPTCPHAAQISCANIKVLTARVKQLTCISCII